MITDQIKIQPKNTLDFSLPKNHTVHKVLIFIKECLPKFERDFKKSKLEIEYEDDITVELSRYMHTEANDRNLIFTFNAKKGVDFTIYTLPSTLGAVPIFMFEAKRLSKKHNDYVYGDTGGIERFKREHDGFGKNLDKGGMIGYIQDRDKGYWLEKVNTWVDKRISKDSELEWNEKDKLVKDSEFSDYFSIHKRISNSNITLYHFWIELN